MPRRFSWSAGGDSAHWNSAHSTRLTRHTRQINLRTAFPGAVSRFAICRAHVLLAIDRTMPTPVYIVDAFAERPFQGNPAAVCPLERPADPAWMQHVAAEMNLSETAFIVSRDGGFDLRWFTPAVEVDLCGHATLASAHLLWERGFAPAGEPIRFQTHSGLLTCTRAG